MVAIERLFGLFRHPRRGQESAEAQADRERGQHMRGRPFIQTADEQADTRHRMEAELDAQRERRAAAKG
jgi:hypothetical protein